MAFPTVSLIDSGERANENPISNGGVWHAAPVIWANPLQVISSQIKGSVAFSAVNGSYYSGIVGATIFQNPTIAATLATLPGGEIHDVVLISCISLPGSSRNYYYLEVAQEATAGKFKVVIGKQVAGTATVLSTTTAVALAITNKIGLQVLGGKVTAWKNAGAWAEIATVSDSTWKEGFIGVVFNDTVGGVTKFEATPPIPVVINPGNQSSVINGTASLTLSGSSVEKWEASGLPPGLTLNEVTGKISGTLEVEGTYEVAFLGRNASSSASGIFFWTVKAEAPTLTKPASQANNFILPITPLEIKATRAAGYIARNLPPGLTINPNTGFISGTPTTAGTYKVGLEAIGLGGTATSEFEWTIEQAKFEAITAEVVIQFVRSTEGLIFSQTFKVGSGTAVARGPSIILHELFPTVVKLTN